jgi:hypothetical protein
MLPLHFPSSLFPSGFSTKDTFVHISLLSHASYIHRPSHHPWFEHPGKCWWGGQIITQISAQFHSESCYAWSFGMLKCTCQPSSCCSRTSWPPRDGFIFFTGSGTRRSPMPGVLSLSLFLRSDTIYLGESSIRKLYCFLTNFTRSESKSRRRNPVRHK